MKRPPPLYEPISIIDPDGLLARHSIHKFASRAVSNKVIPLTSLTEA